MAPTLLAPGTPAAPFAPAVGQESTAAHPGGDLLGHMELGGVSTWTKSSTGGPPAPGQTASEGDEVGLAGLAALGSSEEAQLRGPRFTLRRVRSAAG